MGKHQKQEHFVDNEPDDDASAKTETHELQDSLDNDDDFIDDWISHVDDFESPDDLNNW